MTELADIRRDEQIAGAREKEIRTAVTSALLNLHTGMPGIIQSFDKETCTAQIQPALQRVFTEDGAVNLPLCVDVPVIFTGGGGWWLTFRPVAGDECWLAFSERCIDYWHVNGGVQIPAEWRLHDLSDAVAFVGLNSQPRTLEDIQDFPELRNQDRSIYFKGTEEGFEIKGKLKVLGNIENTGDIDSGGNVSDATSSMQDMRDTYNTHTHISATPGSPTSQPAQPME